MCSNPLLCYCKPSPIREHQIILHGHVKSMTKPHAICIKMLHRNFKYYSPSKAFLKGMPSPHVFSSCCSEIKYFTVLHLLQSNFHCFTCEKVGEPTAYWIFYQNVIPQPEGRDHCMKHRDTGHPDHQAGEMHKQIQYRTTLSKNWTRSSTYSSMTITASIRS